MNNEVSKTGCKAWGSTLQAVQARSMPQDSDNSNTGLFGEFFVGAGWAIRIGRRETTQEAVHLIWGRSAEGGEWMMIGTGATLSFEGRKMPRWLSKSFSSLTNPLQAPAYSNRRRAATWMSRQKRPHNVHADVHTHQHSFSLELITGRPDPHARETAFVDRSSDDHRRHYHEELSFDPPSPLLRDLGIHSVF
ncbi:hypothetical protein B0H16DRAFT_1452103 [Mycena metata]|uniref:Uncharacterized protein n=1 Tax=Mycena metata TaxID=1033252 RepID=A0AAD7NQ16_9AGAR|nr:hypothetical protein B0H16DRAFT_1452103 [Mycena metata]